jgi:hypothetical protein
MLEIFRLIRKNAWDDAYMLSSSKVFNRNPMYLCVDVLELYFDIPSHQKVIWLTVSSRPLEEGYCLTKKPGSKQYFNVETNNGTEEVLFYSGTSETLNEFPNKFYMAIEYEDEKE